MYKLLLCWRYLLTRYLALACIISVMLGVATLIVVNSVMAGFSTKLKDRLHGLLSDVVVEATSLEGFPDAAEKLEQIRRDSFLRDKIEAMTTTLEVFAILQYSYAGETITRPVRLIGSDPVGRAKLAASPNTWCSRKIDQTRALNCPPRHDGDTKPRTCPS